MGRADGWVSAITAANSARFFTLARLTLTHLHFIVLDANLLFGLHRSCAVEFVVHCSPRSATFRHFRYLCVRAFVAARAQYHKVTLLVEMALVGSADLPCFTRHGPRQTVSELVRRFRPDITSQFELSRFVNGLIDQSLDSWSTKWYDKYQRCCVGVF